jgi:hypothetical protein
MKYIKLFENYMISQKLSGIEDLLQSDMIDNILDWGFDFLKKGVSYLMKNELIIELLKNIKPDLLKEGKVRLIFPLEDWETDALEGLKKSGIVTGVFKKTDEALDFIKKLTGVGVKIKELILGSHGNKDFFFLTKEEGPNGHINKFFREISKHIDKNGLVFITSCHGADQLNNLFIASRFLKVRVWGSKGIYNYITNTSEGGFYWCDYEKLKSIDKELKELIYTTRNKAFTSNKWDDFNKLLLDNKICGFSTKSPISWI